jgi:hypothetical protein
MRHSQPQKIGRVGLDAEPRVAVELPCAARKPCPRGDASPTIDHLFRLSMGRFRIPGFAHHIVRLPVRRAAVPKPYRFPRKARRTTAPTAGHLMFRPRYQRPVGSPRVGHRGHVRESPKARVTVTASWLVWTDELARCEGTRLGLVSCHRMLATNLSERKPFRFRGFRIMTMEALCGGFFGMVGASREDGARMRIVVQDSDTVPSARPSAPQPREGGRRNV